MMEFDSLKYNVFMLGYPIGDIRLYNQAFDLWSETWKKVFQASNSMDSYDVDDFCRQQMMSVISDGKGIAALHFYNYFDLLANTTRQHSYLQAVPDSAYNEFNRRDVRYLMSMEYLTISPHWKKSSTGVALSSVMTCLGLALMRQLGVGVVVGFPRKDVKVNKMTYELGFETLVDTVIKCNYPCELVACFAENAKWSGTDIEKNLTDYLWQNATIDPRLLSLFRAGAVPFKNAA